MAIDGANTLQTFLLPAGGMFGEQARPTKATLRYIY